MFLHSITVYGNDLVLVLGITFFAVERSESYMQYDFL